MPVVHITQPDGRRRDFEVASGTTIMRVGVDERVEGIIGECGGAAMCGTCHVFIDPEWLDRLPPMQQNEDDLLDCTAEPRRPQSRLGCQLRITDALDGLSLQLPQRQRW